MMVAPTGPTPMPPAAAAGGDNAADPEDGEVMLAPNLAIPAVLLTTAGLSATAGGGGGAVAAVPLGLLGAFLAFSNLLHPLCVYGHGVARRQAVGRRLVDGARVGLLGMGQLGAVVARLPGPLLLSGEG
eukprot:TRINITY_DN643_c0_g2_i3.p3 TRINITY_DN643_c0_g2~~TRINITY_DN643_c0_g2_i3.p3  ORF type:complete len:129 (-),score=28.85 TRINITY_DN643_c0_g2_i3:558-944(-)